jgi:RNA polymerase sigma-70 factor (ECF subfamily)
VLIPLEAQDRGLWDREMIAEGQQVLDRAMQTRLPGPFQVKAAISALHSEAPTHAATDWQQIVLLYDALFRMEPTDVVRLNRAAALADAGHLGPALREVRAIGRDLALYQPYHAALADLLGRAGKVADADAAYDRAIELSGNAPERAFLKARKEALGAKKRPS